MRRRAQPYPLIAPAGGINGVDPIAAMPEGDAVDLDNFIPIDGGVETREGHAPLHDLGTASGVRAIFDFDDGTGTPESVAASGGKLFSFTSLAFSEMLGTALTSNYWRGAMLNGRLFLVNGADAPQTIERTTGVLGRSDTAWTGPTDITKLSSIAAHANRLFFAESGSSKFWYAALDAVQGALNSLDLSGVGSRGGVIAQIETLTADGATGGADDAIAFYMTSGEVIVYRGSNPADAANWQLVGTFPSAAPIATTKYAGDVLAASIDGYGELSRLMPGGRSPVGGFGQKLGRVATSATSRFGSNLGWQILYHPQRRFLLVHVPQGATRAVQHVANMTTGAWGRFSNFPASTWGHLGNDLVLGTFTGKICRYGGANDDGAPIVSTAQGAWTRLGRPTKKRINMVRPFVTSTAAPIVRHVIASDFRPPVFGATASLAPGADVGVWDASVWDAAVWGGGESVTRDWRGGGTIGDFISVGLRADTTAGRVKWIATSLLVEAGGVL